MKKYFIAVFALAVFASCSKNDVAYTSEWDDMYFSSEDREQLTASTKVFYDENFTEDYEALKSENAVDYSNVNYSSKTVNPEYIAKYTSDNINDDVEDGSTTYYDDEYDQSTASYSSYTGGTPSSIGIYPTFAFGMGTGYGGNPYGYRDPYGFGYGYNDPFRYSNAYGGAFGNPYYSGFSYNSPYYGYGPYGRTFLGGSANAYCPSTFSGYNQQTAAAVNNGNIDRVVSSVRRQTTGPRSSRGSVTDRGANSYRNGNANGSVYYPDGTIQAQTNGRSNTSSQNNYYRRTSTRSTDNASTRSSQSSRSYNNSNAYTRSKANSSASSYTRATNSSKARSSFVKQFISGSSTQRSTGSYSSGRTSTSTGRSSGTGRSGTSSFSVPSRSSSSGAVRSTSSGASRGSSSGSSRSSGRGN